MDTFQQKYGFEEDDRIREYHRNRRMFAVRGNELFIADHGVDYSHADWFKKLGWISEANDSEMATITRGAIEPAGVYFYVDYDFSITASAETEMLQYLPELTKTLAIPSAYHVYGGKILGLPGSKARYRKDYGRIKDLLARDGWIRSMPPPPR